MRNIFKSSLLLFGLSSQCLSIIINDPGGICTIPDSVSESGSIESDSIHFQRGNPLDRHRALQNFSTLDKATSSKPSKIPGTKKTKSPEGPKASETKVPKELKSKVPKGPGKAKKSKVSKKPKSVDVIYSESFNATFYLSSTKGISADAILADANIQDLIERAYTESLSESLRSSTTNRRLQSSVENITLTGVEGVAPGVAISKLTCTGEYTSSSADGTTPNMQSVTDDMSDNGKFTSSLSSLDLLGLYGFEATGTVITAIYDIALGVTYDCTGNVTLGEGVDAALQNYHEYLNVTFNQGFSRLKVTGVEIENGECKEVPDGDGQSRTLEEQHGRFLKGSSFSIIFYYLPVFCFGTCPSTGLPIIDTVNGGRNLLSSDRTSIIKRNFTDFIPGEDFLKEAFETEAGVLVETVLTDEDQNGIAACADVPTDDEVVTTSFEAFSEEEKCTQRTFSPSVSSYPSQFPSENPSDYPSQFPSENPSDYPSQFPSENPSDYPSQFPSENPSDYPSQFPSENPSDYPSQFPSAVPTQSFNPTPRTFYWASYGIIDSFGGIFTQTGLAVELSADGQTVVIGGRSTVRVYSRLSVGTTSSWSQAGQTLYFAPEPTFRAVDISSDGTTIIVGSPQFDSNRGLVNVYKLSELNVWEHLGLNITGNSENTWLGISVGIASNGTRIAIGGDEFNKEDEGQIQVVDFWQNTWYNIDTIRMGSSYRTFGYSVSISEDGDTICGGSYDGDFVACFIWDGFFAFILMGNIIDGRGKESEFSSSTFGRSISLAADEKNTLVIGSAYETVIVNVDGICSQHTGIGYIYEFDGSNWTNTFTTPDYGNQFGTESSISADGNVMIMSSWASNTDELQVIVYERQSDNSWIQRGQMLDGLQTSPVAVSSDGSYIAVGQPDQGTAGYTSLYEWVP